MDFGFKILIETNSGSLYAYTTESLVNLTPGTSQVVTTAQMVDKINSIPSSSYSNVKGAGFSALGKSSFGEDEFITLTDTTFLNTNIGGTGVDHRFLSMSIKDNVDSGSILFQENTASLNGDYLKRYKFFGNKVCNVIGVPENYWIYTDRFRLSNTASLSNHIEGDISATSITVRNNFNVSNVGSISSDLPFNLSKDSDRWIKYVDVSGSVPLNKMLIGYSQGEDYYGIKMPYSTDNLLLSASAVSASGDVKVQGNILASNLSVEDNAGQIFPTVLSSETGSFLTNISYGTTQGVIQKTTPGGGGSPTSLGAITDLGTSGKPKFAALTASGDISASGIINASQIQVDGTAVVEEVGVSATQGIITRTVGGIGASLSLADLRTTGNPTFNNLTINGTASFNDHITIAENKELRFDSSDSFIKADTENPEDLEIHANDDIILNPDDDLFIQRGGTTWIAARGDEREFEVAGSGSFLKNVGIGSTPYYFPPTGNKMLEVDGDVDIDGDITGSDIKASNIEVASQIFHTGDTDTRITFGTNQIKFDAGSTNYDKLRIYSDRVVFNEDSQEYDFRVESNNYTHMLFVDGDTNHIGIGGASGPSASLEIWSENSIAYHFPLIIRNPVNSSTFDYGVGMKFMLDDARQDKFGAISYDATSTYGNAGELNFFVDGDTVPDPILKLKTTGLETSSSIKAGVASPGSEVGVLFRVFTGTTGNTNTNTAVTHGITNGKKRIVSVSVNIQSDDDGPGTIPTNAFIAGGANFQDEATTTREFQTWYDDDEIYIHIDSPASSMANNRYTMIIHYTDADLY